MYMNYGYVRVSTAGQTVENQKLAIIRYCNSINVTIDEWIEETISGSVNFRKRKLGQLFDRLQKDDWVYITEISRFERNVFSVFNMVLELLKKEVNVYSILEDMKIEDSSNCAMKIFSTSYAAQVEREKLIQRTKLGLQRTREQGTILGRRKGYKPKRYKLTDKASYIISERGKGRSKNSLAAELGVQLSTLINFMRMNDIK